MVHDVALLAQAIVGVLEQDAEAVQGVSQDDQSEQEVGHPLGGLSLILTGPKQKTINCTFVARNNCFVLFFYVRQTKKDPSYISVYLRESGAEVQHGGHGADGETNNLYGGENLK